MSRLDYTTSEGPFIRLEVKFLELVPGREFVEIFIGKDNVGLARRHDGDWRVSNVAT